LTKRGRKLYKKRGQTVEPVFGQIKEIVDFVLKLTHFIGIKLTHSTLKDYVLLL
jgi:hypothetical protein